MGDANISLNQIIEGRILRVDDEFVLIDVGYKSEGQIPRNEWDDHEPPPEPGQTIRVLIEDVEDAYGLGEESSRGMITLSKRKAKKIDDWDRVIRSIKEGDTVSVLVLKKIKGGLLVDLDGVNVFLPASQVDVRRPNEIGDYCGRSVECMVLKIDNERRNIVVSRRALIEKVREKTTRRTAQDLEVGQVRKGVVKNIADFGAFVDLGGIDGLLHITDMSGERINHPTEMVKMDQEVEVVVLHIDHERQKIALGMKQRMPSPWDNIAERYPVGSVHSGAVVNVMSYGAFVKLEEASKVWSTSAKCPGTKRVSHPNELCISTTRSRLSSSRSTPKSTRSRSA